MPPTFRVRRAELSGRNSWECARRDPERDIDFSGRVLYLCKVIARVVKWQTHCLQEAALARAWEFKSPLGHKKFLLAFVFEFSKQ